MLQNDVLAVLVDQLHLVVGQTHLEIPRKQLHHAEDGVLHIRNLELELYRIRPNKATKVYMAKVSNALTTSCNNRTLASC